jgi:hypothetical protein
LPLTEGVEFCEGRLINSGLFSPLGDDLKVFIPTGERLLHWRSII